MKKSIIILSMFLGIAVAANAQISTKLKSAAKTASTVAAASGVDASSVKSTILTALTSKLNLSSAQQTKVGSYVTSFLTQKASIASLATTDKTAYASKLKTLTSSLNSKLKTALTAAQYAKYLGLKPSSSTAASALTQLFY